MSVVIGIDASRTATGHRTGTEQYSVQLLEALGALDRQRRYRLYFNSRSKPALHLPANFHARLIPFPRLWTHLRLSLEMVADPPGVLFVPAHVAPLAHPPTVVTIHDLGYLRFPEAHPRRARWYLGLSTRWSATVARRVLVPSSATARDLSAFYGTSDEKIVVVPHGYHPRFRPLPPVEIERGLARLRLQQPYLLFVGTLQPRKNLARVVSAFERVVATGWPGRLVLVGQRGWLADPLMATIQRQAATLGDRIHLLGYVADDDLPLLYNGATALAFPSLYEGFGLPALEAMACGTPVLTSTTSAMPELVESAALTVDPLDTGAIVAGLTRLVSDPALRQDLQARGLARASYFTWERAAARTRAVLDEVIDAR